MLWDGKRMFSPRPCLSQAFAQLLCGHPGILRPSYLVWECVDSLQREEEGNRRIQYMEKPCVHVRVNPSFQVYLLLPARHLDWCLVKY